MSEQTAVRELLGDGCLQTAALAAPSMNELLRARELRNRVESKFAKEAVPEPVLVSRLLEPSSGVVGPFKHLHVAAQSPVAGAAPLLGDVF